MNCASWGDSGTASDHAVEPRGLIKWAGRHASFVRYVIIGGANTGLDLVLYSSLVALADLAPLHANIVSTVVTMCVSYWLNRYFVFRSDVAVARSALEFVTVTLFSGLVVQSFVIWAAIGFAGIAGFATESSAVRIAAKVLAMGVGMISNYLGYRWLFGRR